jgi:hypothetical protein
MAQLQVDGDERGYLRQFLSGPRGAELCGPEFTPDVETLFAAIQHPGDFNALALPIHVGVSREDDRYVLMRGNEQVATTGDMQMADGDGIISTVLFGPDQRTRITPVTTDVLFAAYAPPGIAAESVRDHLADIRGDVLLVAEDAQRTPCSRWRRRDSTLATGHRAAKEVTRNECATL